MKLAIVVGTRPEIVKMAPLIRAAAARGLRPLVAHTGQHYSFEMDAVFFHELGLPEADVNLEVGSGAAAGQLAAIVEGMGAWVERERPDWVLVEGDTNSVLGAALAAHKSGVRVGHVEAGLRSFDRGMPEELNRILTDHLADLLFAPTERAAAQLASEGIAGERVHVTGNTVVDELLLQRERALANGCSRNTAWRRADTPSPPCTAPRTRTTPRGCVASRTASADARRSSGCPFCAHSTRAPAAGSRSSG